MRHIKGEAVALPAAVIEPENLFIAIKRLDRERDDLVLSHILLDALNRPHGSEELQNTSDERSKRRSKKLLGAINQSLIHSCKVLNELFKTNGWRPTVPIYVRELKTSGVERLKPRLSFFDALIYQAIVNLMLPQLTPACREPEGKRVNFTAPIKHEAALGAQLKSAQGGFSYYIREYYYEHWKAYDQIKKLGFPDEYPGARWSMSLDVSAFYDNINHDVLYHQLRALGVDEALISALKAGLDVWQGDEEVALKGVGLPQNFEISGVLSEVYLRPIDELLRELGKQGYRGARYVDDICIVTTSQDTAALGELGLRSGPLRQISSALRRLGLHINPSKREMRRLPPWSIELTEDLNTSEEQLTTQARSALEEVLRDPQGEGREGVEPSEPSEPLQAPSPKREAEELPSDPQALLNRCLDELQRPSASPSARATLYTAGVELLMSIQRQAISDLKRPTSYYHVSRRRGRQSAHMRRIQELLTQFEQMIQVAEREARETDQTAYVAHADVDRLKAALQALNDESGRTDVLSYLNDPQLKVTQPPEGEGGEVEEALKHRLKRFNRLLKGARTFLYGESAQEHTPPNALADLLLEIAGAEELLLMQVTRLLDHFEHTPARVERCVSLVRTHKSSATARYTVYRHLAELRSWPQELELSKLLTQLAHIEAESPNALGVVGLVELIDRRAEPSSHQTLTKALFTQLRLPQSMMDHLIAHHRNLSSFSETSP